VSSLPWDGVLKVKVGQTNAFEPIRLSLFLFSYWLAPLSKAKPGDFFDWRKGKPSRLGADELLAFRFGCD
jgi:hypothetical protein